MTFLTSQPDLSGTTYEQQSLREPREYLVSEIRKMDPVWLDEPQGPLGDYWKQDDTYVFFTFEIWAVFYAWSDGRAGHFEVTSSAVRPGVESAHHSVPGW